MKTVAIIQARMGSTRLPGKVLKPLWESRPTVLDCVYHAVQYAKNIDEVIVATSDLAADDAIRDHCYRRNMTVLRGSESDVLNRFMDVAFAADADIVLRLTADCPFLDPSVIEQVVRLRHMTGADYCSNIDPPTWPDGLDVECFTMRALEEAHQEATRPSDRDCVTRFISRNRSRFKAANLTCPMPGLEKERWVLDAQDDYEFCCELAKRVTQWPPSYLDILAILDKEPQLRKLNQNHVRNERFYEGISAEDLGPRTYARSQTHLKRAERYIPLGAQTFSKSKLQFSDGAPLFLSHGDGAYVYDVDGNDYVDLVSALLPNILGYRDPDVDRAVRHQLDSGASLSLATDLEYELAQRLNTLLPYCAEMVRFGKTGSDVTSAAVRLARAYTGKDLVLKARHGYHGWHDWAVCLDPMRKAGVDDANTVGLFEYGDMKSIHRLIPNKSGCAAIIVEPETDSGFLSDLRLYCDETETVLIFDEVITGFRWSIGGAQYLYSVTPDLACFGKAMGNGMPISALVGKREIMQWMAPPDNIFYSGTFFGETLSLAAACATIDKLQRQNVIGHIWDEGANLRVGIANAITKHDVGGLISVGQLPLSRLTFANRRVQDIFTRAMADAGVLIINSNNLTWAHRAPQISRIMKAYDYACGEIAKAKGQLAA